MKNNTLNGKIRTLINLGVILISVIVIIWVASSMVKSATSPTTTISNYSQTDVELTSEEKEYFDTALAEILNAHYADKFKKYSDLTLTIRPDTFSTTQTEGSQTTTFIVDIDELKLTYDVSIRLPEEDVAVMITCPSPSLMKYSNTFCIGHDNSSSIDTILGDYLPYTGFLDDERPYTIAKSLTDDNYPALSIYLSSCESENLDAQAISAAKSWINSLETGVSADIFTYQVINRCTEED